MSPLQLPHIGNQTKVCKVEKSWHNWTNSTQSGHDRMKLNNAKRSQVLSASPDNNKSNVQWLCFFHMFVMFLIFCVGFQHFTSDSVRTKQKTDVWDGLTAVVAFILRCVPLPHLHIINSGLHLSLCCLSFPFQWIFSPRQSTIFWDYFCMTLYTIRWI